MNGKKTQNSASRKYFDLENIVAARRKGQKKKDLQRLHCISGVSILLSRVEYLRKTCTVLLNWSDDFGTWGLKWCLHFLFNSAGQVWENS